MYVWLVLAIWFGLGLVAIISILLQLKLYDLLERQYTYGSWRIRLSRRQTWTKLDMGYLALCFFFFPFGIYVLYVNGEECQYYIRIIRRQRAITRR